MSCFKVLNMYLVGKQTYVIMSVDFGAKLKRLLEKMDWLGLANLLEMKFSPHLINEFYLVYCLRRVSQIKC